MLLAERREPPGISRNTTDRTARAVPLIVALSLIALRSFRLDRGAINDTFFSNVPQDPITLVRV